jgi:hypothetical protein
MDFGAVLPPVLDGKIYKQFPEFQRGNLSMNSGMEN